MELAHARGGPTVLVGVFNGGEQAVAFAYHLGGMIGLSVKDKRHTERTTPAEA